MASFREPGPDDPTTRPSTGVWTTRPTAPTTRQATVAPPPAATGPVGDGPTGAADRTRAGWRLPLRGIAKALGWGLLALAAVTLAQIAAYRFIAPPTSMLMLAQRATGTRIERAWRPLDRISPHLARAVIMSEDAGFCGHRGVDWRELERVYEQSLDGGSSGGGSTISMQVTKNLFLWSSKSYVRKAIEVPLTLLADRWWGKRRMLEIYLNVAEWGPGIFGAEAAARSTFNKAAADLTEAEAALLAVALPNPLSRNAANPAPRQRRMATVVQGRMKAGANNVRCIGRPAA